MLLDLKRFNIAGKSQVFDISTGLSGALDVVVTNGSGGHLILWGGNRDGILDYELDRQSITDNDFGVLYDISSIWMDKFQIEITLGTGTVLFKTAVQS